MRIPSPVQRRILETLASGGEIHLDRYDRATLMPAGEFVGAHVINALRRTPWLVRDRSSSRPRIFRITDEGREALSYIRSPRSPRPRLDAWRVRSEVIWPDVNSL